MKFIRYLTNPGLIDSEHWTNRFKHAFFLSYNNKETQTDTPKN